MEQQQEVQTIFFKDLFFATFYQWKKILIAAVVFGLLLGGLQFIKTRNASAATTDATVLEQVAHAQKVYDSTKDALTNHTAYLAESLLMNLDPTHVCVAGADVYVTTEQSLSAPDKSLAILRAYQTALKDHALLTSTAESLSHDSAALSELVVTRVLDEAITPTLSITVFYSDEAGAQLILDALLQGLDVATENICKNVAAHAVSVTPYSQGSGANWLLIETQTAANTRLDLLNNLLKTYKTNLDNTKAALPQSGKSPVLLAIIGAFLGAALVVCYTWVMHIASNRIYSARVLKARTGIKILGCVPATKYSCVDQWLRKLEGRSTNAKSADIAAANVRNYCKDTNHLLVIGDCSGDIAEQVRAIFANTDVRISVCGSLISDAEALQLLPTCDAVLLAEQCGRSTYTQVEQTMESIADLNKKLLGCFLLDG